MESYDESFGAKVFKLILYVIIGLFGVIGNILVCIVVLKTAKLRSSTYYFICSLAVADIGVLIACFPLAVIKQELVGEWPFGETFCLYFYPATETVFGASIWSITVIAIERYRIVVANRPKIATRSSKNRRYELMVIAAVWLGNFLLAGIPIYAAIKYEYKKSCTPDWTFDGKEPKQILGILYQLALTSFWYIIPLCVISFTYWAISRKIKERSDFLSRIGMRSPRRELKDADNDRDYLKHDNKSRMKKDMKARRLLTPLVVVFAVTMFPLNLFRVLTISWSGFPQWFYYRLFYDVMIFFTITNSAANPIIYTIFSNDFRTGFGNLMHLKQLKRCTDGPSDSGETNTSNLSGIAKIISPRFKRKHQKKTCATENVRHKYSGTYM